jgi:hypothetical protein
VELRKPQLLSQEAVDEHLLRCVNGPLQGDVQSLGDELPGEGEAVLQIRPQRRQHIADLEEAQPERSPGQVHCAGEVGLHRVDYFAHQPLPLREETGHEAERTVRQ